MIRYVAPSPEAAQAHTLEAQRLRDTAIRQAGGLVALGWTGNLAWLPAPTTHDTRPDFLVWPN